MSFLSTLHNLRSRKSGRHITDDIFKCIFLNENVWILIKISLKFVPKGPINNIPALVQIMTWRQPGDKPLSEPIIVSILMHICVTLPQRVKHVNKMVWDIFSSQHNGSSTIIQCCAFITWLIFFQNPHKRRTIARSLGRVMGCLIWIETRDLYSITVGPMVYMILWHTGPCYNGTSLYLIGSWCQRIMKFCICAPCFVRV